MGYRLESDPDAEAWLKRLDQTESVRTLPPVLVVRHKLQPAQIPINVGTESHGHTRRLIREDGEIVERGRWRYSGRQPQILNPRTKLVLEQARLP
jgi:hypothetical protein